MNSHVQLNQTRPRRSAADVRRHAVDSARVSSFTVGHRPQEVAQRALQDTLNQTSRVQAQTQLQQSLNQSPRMVAQAKLAASLQRQSAPPVVQRQDQQFDEDELQLKSDPMTAFADSRPEEEELLQGKLEPVQRQDEFDEEELLQGRLLPAQLQCGCGAAKKEKEDEVSPPTSEPLQRQGDFDEEELLQGRFAPVQRQDFDEDDLLQGKFSSTGQPTQFQSVSEPMENRTGMSDQLKTGLEHLSGLDLSSVRVHHNSAKPAQMNALAYAQGQDIHVGPGQERHLPHEGWHAVQQMQDRVKPTTQAKGVAINDDAGLEREADVMGAKALQITASDRAPTNSESLQRMGANNADDGQPGVVQLNANHESQTPRLNPGPAPVVIVTGTTDHAINNARPDQTPVQRAYGPTDVSVDGSGLITGMTLAGGRPGVSSSIPNASREDYAYRHFTMWAVIRDSLAQKYIGKTYAAAISAIRKTLGMQPDPYIDPTKANFIYYLKLEMKSESDKGAMGSAEQNAIANSAERTSEAEMRKNPAKLRVEKWIADALDKDFIQNHSNSEKIDLATTHMTHAIRAAIYRVKGSSTKNKRDAYTTLAKHRDIESFVDGTLKKFDATEVNAAALKFHLEAAGVDLSTKLKDIDSLDVLETAIKSFDLTRQLELLKEPDWDKGVFTYEELRDEWPQIPAVAQMVDFLSMEVDGDHPYIYYGRTRW